MDEYSSNFTATITLDKGRADGVDVGYPVVGAGGLVGQVIQSFHHTSVVRLVTDGQSKVGVTFGNRPAHGDRRRARAVELHDGGPRGAAHPAAQGRVHVHEQPRRRGLPTGDPRGHRADASIRRPGPARRPSTSTRRLTSASWPTSTSCSGCRTRDRALHAPGGVGDLHRADGPADRHGGTADRRGPSGPALAAARSRPRCSTAPKRVRSSGSGRAWPSTSCSRRRSGCPPWSGAYSGYAVGSLTTAADPRATWLKPVAAAAGSVGADMLFAVLGAILGQGEMVQVDFLSLILVVGISSVVLVLPGQPADAVGPGRGEQPPLTGSGPGRQQGLVKRTLRHPIRGDRLHPKPSDTPGEARLLAGKHRGAADAAPQERQRGLHRRLARGGGGPPQSPPAHRRDRRPAPLRRPRPAAVDAAGGRGEELRRGRDPQPGARGQRGRPPWRDRRP